MEPLPGAVRGVGVTAAQRAGADESHNAARQVKLAKGREIKGERQAAAAARLGVRTLTPSDYDRDVQDVERRDARAWRHGRAGTSLPVSDQIMLRRTWDAAPRVAGLEPHERPGVKRGTPVEALLTAFVEAFDCVPSSAMVER